MYDNVFDVERAITGRKMTANYKKNFNNNFRQALIQDTNMLQI